MVQTAFYQLRQICTIISSLTAAAAETMVHAFISSRLDYCSTLLQGISGAQIARLQSVQNAAAHLITGSRRHEHISPILHDLHSLRISQRVEFRTALTVFKCLNGLAPPYLVDLCMPLRTINRPSGLRSNTSNQLHVPRTRTSIGGRSFAVSGPTTWNRLPAQLQDPSLSLPVFARTLKTHLFANTHAAHS